MFASVCLLFLTPVFPTPAESPIQSERVIVERFPSHAPFALTAIRQRSSTEAIASWDEYGLPRKATGRNAPLPPKVPGKKVREFLFASPLGVPLLAQAAPGAEIVQMVQDREVTLVAVAFSLDAKVASLRLAVAKPAGEAGKSLAFRPYDRFDPGRGTAEERFGEGLRWFVIPRQAPDAHLTILGPSGEPLPLLGGVRREGASEMYVAVRATDAERLTTIEAGPSRPDWRPIENLLLDPAPPLRTRADAPVARLSLEGGGSLSLLRIASRVAGRPYRAWTIDGGPPAPVEEKPYWAGMSPHSGLEFFLQTERPPNLEQPYFQELLLDGRFSAVSYAGGFDGMFRVFYALPPGLTHADLHVRYALGPWQEALEEAVQGERLRAVPSAAKNAFQPNLIALRYVIPARYRDFNRTLEAYDAQGRMLRRASSSSEDWPSKDGDGVGNCHFESASVADVARVRLLVRPLHRGVIKGIPLNPP